jgi:predicted  nucleic acid-binding Zn-ribbon protein
MFLKCVCNNCPGHIEFEESNAGQTVTCPHCGLETVLYVPQKQSADNSRPTAPIARTTAPQSPPAKPQVRPVHDEAKCNCQRCGKTLAFPPQMVGQDITCPHCGRETTLLAPRAGKTIPAIVAPAKESAYGDLGGLVLAGYITAVLMPLVGFIIGIILLAKNRPGSGIGCIIVSVICVFIALAIFSS